MPPTAAKALISLGRTNRKWRRFVIEDSGFASYPPRVTITDPPDKFECKHPPKVKTDHFLLVFARPRVRSSHVGDTEDITYTVTNDSTGDVKSVGGAKIVYEDDDDPPTNSSPADRPGKTRRRRPTTQPPAKAT
jgi:hypothetical protein